MPYDTVQYGTEIICDRRGHPIRRNDLRFGESIRSRRNVGAPSVTARIVPFLLNINIFPRHVLLPVRCSRRTSAGDIHTPSKLKRGKGRNKKNVLGKRKNLGVTDASASSGGEEQEQEHEREGVADWT